jgi:hypothetical protein
MAVVAMMMVAAAKVVIMWGLVVLVVVVVAGMSLLSWRWRTQVRASVRACVNK